MHPYWCLQQTLDLSYVLRSLLGKPDWNPTLQTVPDADVSPRLLSPVGRNLRSTCFNFHSSAAGRASSLAHTHTHTFLSHISLDSRTPELQGASSFSPSDGKQGFIFTTYVQQLLFGGRREIHKLSSHCTCLLGLNSPTRVCSLELSRSWAGRPAGKSSDYRHKQTSEGRGWAAAPV